MKTITNTFKLHIDPSLYNFRWTEAQYVDVTYKAGITDNGHVVAVADVSGPIYFHQYRYTSSTLVVPDLLLV